MLDTWTLVVLDTRLTPEAARLALYIASLGDGEHEVRRTDFAALLNHPGEKGIREALRVGVEAGWLDRRPGGRGHPDRFAFRVAPGATLSDRVPPGGSLNALRVPAGATLSVSSSSSGVDVGGDLTTARERLYPIAETVLAAMDKRASDFNGCRSSVVDYLARRVPTDRQHGWIYAVAGWFDGMDVSVFRYPDGSTLPADQRSKVMAAGLNELMSTNEATGFSRPSGDAANLKTKIQILLRQWASNAHPKRSADPAATTSPARSATGRIGANQGRHVVEG